MKSSSPTKNAKTASIARLRDPKSGTDIFCTDTGANASAEAEEEEGGDEEVQRVNNIVHSFNLNETSFDAKAYKSYIKGK